MSSLARQFKRSEETGIRITITPTMAKEMLAKTEALGYANYRRKLKSRISLYADDMKAGRWKYNGEPILTGMNGEVLDGQNRLWACIKANASFDALVVYDVSEDAVDTMNTGAPRTFRDILERRGFSKADVLAATVPFIYNWEKTGGVARDVTNHASRMALKECLDRHPRLIDYTQKNKNLHDLGLADSFTSALRYVLVLASDEETAYQFLGELAMGDLLKERSPVFQLRKRLIRNVVGKASKLTPRTKFALTAKAWNLWLSGQECLQLKWTSVGPGEEAFPAVLTRADVEAENS